MNTTGPFFFVKDTASGSYECGTGLYAVPKLYQMGPAKSLVGRRNKMLKSRGKPQTYAIVPVLITVGEPQ